jgi:peptidoglycan/xylan/chitin deacetylase (PgdA/CDA1 family)
VHDLKLSIVRLAIGRATVALILLLAAAFVLQLNDSVAVPRRMPAPPVAVDARFRATQGDGTRHEYFISHQQVIPVGASSIELPILMYHYIRTPPSTRTDLLGYKLSVSPQDFQTQMDWLAANGFHPVDFNDVRTYFAGVHSLPSNPVIITLDDGYQDLYTTAFPILAAYGFKAVAYIVSGFVDQPRYVSRAQVVEMDRAGIEIASHTVDHADLARSSSASVMFQVVQSKHWLEQLVGHPVVDFAYPSGQFNAQVIAALKLAGYDTAVTEQTSTVHSLADRYAWARVRVGGGESLRDFILNLGPTMKTTMTTTVDVESGTDASTPPEDLG